MNRDFRDMVAILFAAALGCAFLFLFLNMWSEAIGELVLVAVLGYILAKNPAA